MKSRILSAILSAIIVLVSLTACHGTFEVGLEHSAAAAPGQTSTPTTAPVSTTIPIRVATYTTVPEPIDTPVLPEVTESQPLTTEPAATQDMVDIYLIAVDDNGQSGNLVGCGDSAVPVQVQIQPTQGVLKAALEALLSIKEQFYGQSGLYNALYQSDLQVDKVTIDHGIASVYLTGTLLLGGECDNPRVQAQLEQTVLQFSTVTQADIFINSKPLADALSLKG